MKAAASLLDRTLDPPSRVIASTVSLSFYVYLTIGMTLGVLPIYVHKTLGYRVTVAGAVIGAQYVATLLSRPYAGHKADLIGPKKTVQFGLVLCAGSGGLLLISGLLPWAGASLATLLGSRLALGCAESLVATGAIVWGIGRAGVQRTTQVISYNGIATYGALAVGAPFGLLVSRLGGLWLVGAAMALVGVGGWAQAVRLAPSAVVSGKKLPFQQVFSKVALPGTALALGGVGFGAIAAFVTLFFSSRRWPHGELALTLYCVFFVAVRILFAREIDRRGGCVVAIASLAVEALGLLLLALSRDVGMALLGAALVGCGFSLVFPALGTEAVRRVAASDRGTALGVYSVFVDVSLGVTGPALGEVIAQMGYPPAFVLAGAASVTGLVLAGLLARRAGAGTRLLLPGWGRAGGPAPSARGP